MNIIDKDEILNNVNNNIKEADKIESAVFFAGSTDIKYFKFNEDEVKKQTFLRNPNSKIFKINSLKKGEAKEFAKWLVKKI